MKKRNNKGVTLVELLVSLTVLSVLMIAVIGFMTVFINIYRNRKRSRSIQQTAQSIYDNMSDAIMQADIIEIKGYTYSGSGEKTEVDFTLDNGTIRGGSTEYAVYANTNTTSLSEFKCNVSYKGSKYKVTDIWNNTVYYETWLSNFNKTTNGIDRNDIVWKQVPEYKKVNTLYGSDISKFIDYVNVPAEVYYDSSAYVVYEGGRFKKFDSAGHYVQVPASDISSVSFNWGSVGTATTVAGKRSFNYLKTGSTPMNLYITEIKIHQSVQLDWKYAIKTAEDSDGNHYDGDERWSSNPGNDFLIKTDVDGYHYLTLRSNQSLVIDHDEVTTTYTFDKNVMTVSSKYKYMYKLNTYSNDDAEYTNLIKFLNIGGKDVPGVIARVDAENQSIELEIHVGNNKESYVSTGIINLKNNNVLMYEE